MAVATNVRGLCRRRWCGQIHGSVLGRASVNSFNETDRRTIVCGIAGWLGAGEGLDLEAMMAALHHRGPDDSGQWVESDIALGHLRLSILDTSSAGHQPMHSHDGRWVMVFNGEIYNHLELRAMMPDVEFASTSDTETLLEAISRWGLHAAIDAAIGMFAIAVFDRHERALWLVRDRFGKKPLYLLEGVTGSAFASEPKALVHGGAELNANSDALRHFLALGFVHGEQAAFDPVRRLPPASITRLRLDGEPHTTIYWHHDQQPRGPGPSLGELQSVLEKAVQQRMISDVPLGTFLSGGIDSSLIVAMMQRVSDEPVKTFSIGFEEAEFDEAPHARRIAEHLGTDHTEKYVSAEEALAVVREIPKIWCEPFADPSAIPTLLVSRMAREHVTVALSGDGGDEVFGGYDRYRVARQFELLRKGLGSRGARVLARVPDPLWRIPSSVAGIKITRARWQRLAAILGMGVRDAYADLLAPWPTEEYDEAGVHSPSLPWPAEGTVLHKARHCDMSCYLPEDILVKVDRASMATSLEVRAPLLDSRILALAERFRDRDLMRRGVGKLPLRHLLAQAVPRKLWDRPKQGFGIPVNDWLRGALRPWAEDLLADPFDASGILSRARVERIWSAQQNGDDRLGGAVWNMVMLAAWEREWLA